MKLFLCCVTVAALLCAFSTEASTQRGAQIRLTANGMNYAASLGVRKLQQDLTNKRLNPSSGNKGDVSYSASNINLNYVRIGNYKVQPIANTGIQLSVSKLSVQASGKISLKYKKGWFKVSDSTNVKIKGSNIGFNLRFRVDARNGKPQVAATSCNANVGDLDLDFSGGLSWVYNTISSLFSGKIEDIIEKLICVEGTKLINKEANNLLKDFKTQEKIDDIAIIDYSFQQPEITNNYLDLMLRGEFLNPKNPQQGSEAPPAFNTITASNKMVYVWLTDYTLNSAGKVLHETGIIKKLVGPLMKEIPAEMKPFLNTNSFAQMIPELARRFPNRPLEFQLASNQPPTFELTPGFGKVNLNIRATVAVDKTDGTKLSVFHMDLNVKANGTVFVKMVGDQLYVGGNIADFSFGVSFGGSVIGDINVPIDSPEMKKFVEGLVITNANPPLNKGFPIPKIDKLNFVNPNVEFVSHAVRVGTDVTYAG